MPVIHEVREIQGVTKIAWNKLTPSQVKFTQAALEFIQGLDHSRVSERVVFSGSLPLAEKRITELAEQAKQCGEWEVFNPEGNEEFASRLRNRADEINLFKKTEPWLAGYEVWLAENGVKKVLDKVATR